MSFFGRNGSVLGKRQREDSTQPGHTLFVTGNTPAPQFPQNPYIKKEPQQVPPGSWDFETFGVGGAGSGGGDLEDEGDDDDDDDDDDDEEEEIYSQEQEKFPTAAAYDPRTLASVERAGNLAIQLSQVLQPHLHSSADVATMANRAVQMMIRPGTKKQTIMLLGHTGTGKSSTTNSFVDDLDASKAAATGESCTCVPTLITSGLERQERKYAAEIRIFDEETRRAFLLEHVNNYNRYAFEHDQTWSEEEEYDYRSQYETAEKVLRALFCDRFDFDSPGKIRAHLSTARENALGSLMLINDLALWCNVLLGDCVNHATQPTLRFDADTAAELGELLEPHTFESGNFDQPALWPIIEHVRKGIHGLRILRYVNFLDLPGTFDTNRVRAEFAHKFIRESDALWTVTSIERPLSDAQLDRTLATYAESFGNNVAIIATRSDTNIDDGLAKAMRAKKQSVGDYWQQSARIKEINAAISAIDTQLRRSKGRQKSQKRQKTMSDAAETKLRREKEDLEEALENVKNEQLDGLVDVRNSHIAAQLKADKRKHLAAGSELSVFCVSNTHYNEHKGIGSGDSRVMSVETTNIPALRSHALRMAASREFNVIEDYINETLTLLKGAALWADSAPEYGRATLVDVAQQPKALLNSIMDDFLETTDDKCNGRLIRPMISRRKDYVAAAVRVKTNFLTTWHHSTVRAFFRRDGNHSTKTRPHEAWNERFQDEQTATIEGVWYVVIAEQKITLRGGVEKVIKALGDIPEQLSSKPAFHCLTSLIKLTNRFWAGSNTGSTAQRGPLLGMIDTCSNRIRTAYDTRMEQLDKKMSNIKQDTTRDVPSGYFTTAMRGMYEVSKSYTGTGCTKRMWDTLETWLSGKPPQYGSFNSPFAAVSTSLQTEFSNAITTVAEALQNDILTILLEMTQHFERALQGEVNNAVEIGARAAIKPALHKLKPEIQAIERELETIKQQYGITRE